VGPAMGVERLDQMVANGFGYALFNARPKSSQALDGRGLTSVRIAGERHHAGDVGARDVGPAMGVERLDQPRGLQLAQRPDATRT
jgi:hypothetical protein